MEDADLRMRCNPIISSFLSEEDVISESDYNFSSVHHPEYGLIPLGR